MSSAAAILKAVQLASNLVTIANALNAERERVLGMRDRINAICEKATAEGRDHLTDAEWAEITALDDTARARLDEAIAKAKASEA